MQAAPLLFQLPQTQPPMPVLMFAACSMLINALGFYLAWRKYQTDRKNDIEERRRVREATIKEDAERHAENRAKMDSLLAFQQEQLLLNRQRDQQISELKEQTLQIKASNDAMKEIAQAIRDETNRRLERLENNGA